MLLPAEKSNAVKSCACVLTSLESIEIGTAGAEEEKGTGTERKKKKKEQDEKKAQRQR